MEKGGGSVTLPLAVREKQEENRDNNRGEDNSGKNAKQQRGRYAGNRPDGPLRRDWRIKHSGAGEFSGRNPRSTGRGLRLKLALPLCELVRHRKIVALGCWLGSKKTKDRFDRDPGRDCATIGVTRRVELPTADGLHGAFL